MRCPFLLRLCQEVLLRGFRWFFFFRCSSFCRKRKVNAECVSLPHEWNRRPHTAGNPGRIFVATRLNKFRRIGNKHTSFGGVCPFHASGDVFFFWWFPLFTDFLLKFFSTQSASVFVYLHFCAFQWAASGSHFRSGRKGNSGIGRESKVKPPVFCGNLQPFG